MSREALPGEIMLDLLAVEDQLSAPSSCAIEWNSSERRAGIRLMKRIIFDGAMGVDSLNEQELGELVSFLTSQAGLTGTRWLFDRCAQIIDPQKTARLAKLCIDVCQRRNAPTWVAFFSWRLSERTRSPAEALREMERFLAIAHAEELTSADRLLLANKCIGSRNWLDARRHVHVAMATLIESGEMTAEKSEDCITISGLIDIGEHGSEAGLKWLGRLLTTEPSQRTKNDGPGMRLALRVLELGFASHVRAYVCWYYLIWESGSDAIPRWSDDILHGRTPDCGLNSMW